MEDYLAVISEETLSFVTMRMNLEGVMLSEVSQTEKEEKMISPFCGI